MKSLISVLREIVDPSHIVEEEVNNCFKLEEKNQTVNYYVKLSIGDKVDSCLLIHLDKEGLNIHPFLRANEEKIKNLRKCCDYLLFCEVEEKIYAFPIELKSKDSSGWKRQVRAGIAFAQYLIAFAEVREYAHHSRYKPVNFRGILFKQGNPIKRKTGADPYSVEEVYQYKYVQKSFKGAPKTFQISEFFDPRNSN